MKFLNTRNHNNLVSFKEATIKGLANGGGLFFPLEVPKYSLTKMNKLLSLPRIDLATEVMNHFVGDNIPKEELKIILDVLFPK